MAIKVKHEGSTASRLAAAAQGGAAKRAMEAAALAKPSQIQTLQAAHASAPGISTPHAQLIGAPGGGAHAGLIGGGGGIGARLGGARRGTSGTDAGSGSRRVVRGSGDALDGDYKVTGTSIFNRPDDDSVWRDDLQQWIRPWLPGEKEAEALRRTGEVQNELAEERELTAQGRRERAALVEDVVNSIKAGRFSREELPALMEQFSGAEDTIKMADALREREPTAQEQLDKRRVVLDGIPGIYDNKGNFVPSSSFRDTSEQKQMDYDLRREELAAKRLDSQRTNANKMITDLMKPVKTGKDNRGNDTFRAMSYEEALKIAKKAYPDVYNPPAASQEAPAGSGMADPVIAARTDVPAPTTEATAEPTSTEDDDEFAKFRRK